MDAFIGEIRAFPYRYAPLGWQECDGRTLSVHEYQILFAVIGNRFGGDGKTNFMLPDLRGRAALDAGILPGTTTRADLGATLGDATATITEISMPIHDHTPQTHGSTSRLTAPSVDALILNPQYLVGTKAYSFNMYASLDGGAQQMASNAIESVGGGLPHNNLSPYLVMRFCICFDGNWPPHP